MTRAFSPLSLVALVLACAPAVELPAVDTSGMEPPVARRIEAALAGVEQHPRSARAWGELGQVLHAHGELGAAIRAYGRARELEPAELRWSYDLACAAQEDRRPLGELEPLFAAAARLAPDHAPLYCRLGDARMRAGETERAAEAYRAALELDPELAQAHRGLGNARLALGDAEGARAHLERAAELRPEDSVAWAALARAWRLLDRAELARQAAERADAGRPIDRIPDPYREEVALLAVSSAALLGRADSALAAGDARRSAEHLAEVARARPEDPWVWRNLALALRRAGRLEEARGAAGRAIELAPRFALGHLELGKVFEVEGRLEEALGPYRRVVDLEPELEAGWARLAAALQNLGRTAQSLATYAEAEGHIGLGPETLADWGVALLAAEDFDEAAGMFERALALDARHERAREGLSRARIRGGDE